jgi:hypothetical protein
MRAIVKKQLDRVVTKLPKRSARRSTDRTLRSVNQSMGRAQTRASGQKLMTVAQAIREASKLPLLSNTHSHFKTDITRKRGRKVKSAWRHNLTTTTATGYTNAYDWLAKAMAAGPSTAYAVAQGAATATSATSLTAPTGFPVTGQALAGCIVVACPNSSGTGSKVWGYITSNTATVLTVDQWYDPTSTSGAAGVTPNATCSYVVVNGQAPAPWMCLSISVFTPATSDISLNTQGAELAANGFSRAVGTYAHTAAASTYTLIHLWTATGTDTINNEGISGAATILTTPNFGGVFPFESAEPSPPTLVSGDTLQNTVTVTI